MQDKLSAWAKKPMNMVEHMLPVDRALDLVIAEHERNRLTLEANERFIASGIEIKDVYGKLAD